MAIKWGVPGAPTNPPPTPAAHPPEPRRPEQRQADQRPVEPRQPEQRAPAPRPIEQRAVEPRPVEPRVSEPRAPAPRPVGPPPVREAAPAEGGLYAAADRAAHAPTPETGVAQRFRPMPAQARAEPPRPAPSPPPAPPSSAAAPALSPQDEKREAERARRARGHVSDDPRREITLGLITLLLFFGVFMGWAATAPLDAGVVAPGVVVVSGNRQTVQHRDGGIVSRILVEEGQRVAAGDVLLELSATEIFAREQAVAAQVIDLQLQRAQLVAEALGRSTIERPQEWAELSPETRALAETAFARHTSEMAARRNASRAQRANTAEINARIAGYEDQIAAIDRQMALLRDELSSMRDLAAEQLVPLPRVRALERGLAELQGQKAQLRSLIATVQNDQAQQQREIEAQIAELTPQWVALQEQLERARLRAPVSGVVVGLQVHTIGGVVRASEPVMDIVPEGQALVVEAQVHPRDADDLRVGMTTQVRISAFQSGATPIMRGTLRRISADRFVDERTGAPYFKVNVEVSSEDLQRELEASGGVGGELRPGLPAEIIVATRKRTALEYLVEPLGRTFWRSFREN